MPYGKFEIFYRLWFRAGTEALDEKKRKLRGTLYALHLHWRMDGSALLTPALPYPAVVLPPGEDPGMAGEPPEAPEGQPEAEDSSWEALCPLSWLLQTGQKREIGSWHTLLGVEHLGLGSKPEQGGGLPWSLEMGDIGSILPRAIGAPGLAVKGGPDYRHYAWRDDQSAIRGGRLLLGESIKEISARMMIDQSDWGKAETEDRPVSKPPEFRKDHPRHIYNEYGDVPNEPISRARWRKESRSRQRRLPKMQLACLRKELEARIQPQPDALIERLRTLHTIHDRKAVKYRMRSDRREYDVDD